MRKIYKTDIFGGRMDSRQFNAGRSMEKRMYQEGKVLGNSMDAEKQAPRTWILWADGPDLPGGRGKPIIECELYAVPRASDSNETVGMLIAQCPVCYMHHKQDNYITVREDNKGMSIGTVEYGRLPKGHHLRDNYALDCEAKGRQPRSTYKIPMISSPERWQCDYCMSWCVRVTDSVAHTDMRGATQIITGGNRIVTPGSSVDM